MKPLSEDPDAAALEPMTEDEEAWALLARCPVDAPDRAALAVEIGAKFRSLREHADLTQVQVASYSATLHHPLVSSWERGERLEILARHAPYLVDALGLDVLRLVQPSLAARGFGDLERRVIDAINGFLRGPVEARAAARAAGDLETVDRLEGQLGTLPTLDELAQLLGIDTPLSAADEVHLIHTIVETGRQGGWTIGRTS